MNGTYLKMLPMDQMKDKKKSLIYFKFLLKCEMRDKKRVNLFQNFAASLQIMEMCSLSQPSQVVSTLK